MASYRLKSSSTVLIDVPSSSSLDNPSTALTRRGTVFKTLKGIVVQYTASARDDRIIWTIPLANSNQYGVLYSASIGMYGDTLIFNSPNWGDISVAFIPGEDALVMERHPGTFGYKAVVTFVRLS